MHYTITHRNPNNAIVTEPRTIVVQTLGEVRTYIDRSKQYPGSLEIIRIEKVTARGAVEMLPR